MLDEALLQGVLTPASLSTAWHGQGTTIAGMFQAAVPQPPVPAESLVLRGPYQRPLGARRGCPAVLCQMRSAFVVAMLSIATRDATQRWTRMKGRFQLVSSSSLRLKLGRIVGATTRPALSCRGRLELLWVGTCFFGDSDVNIQHGLRA